jgi:hypothetical protein
MRCRGPSRLIVCVAALVCAANSARAQIKAEITEWGEAVGERAGDAPSEAGTGLLPARVMTNVVYVSRTDHILAQLCRHFGATVRVAGAPVPGRVEVRVRHPLLTAPNGATSVEDRFSSYLADGASYAGFTFERRWEMQPGLWTIEFLVEGAAPVSKTFTISPPPPGEPDTVCDGKPVS